jgi:hypothetical protein
MCITCLRVAFRSPKLRGIFIIHLSMHIWVRLLFCSEFCKLWVFFCVSMQKWWWAYCTWTAGIWDSKSCVHLEYVCVNTTAKPLSATPNIAEDMTIWCFMSTEALVENGNFNEGVSWSNIWHAPSTHKRDYTAEFTKRLVKNWRRYSSLKICKNEMSEITWLQSHLETTIIHYGSWWWVAPQWQGPSQF